MAIAPPREDLRSAEYLAEKLSVHPKTIARWVREGKIVPDETHKKWNGENKPEQEISLFRESTVEELARTLRKDPE
jgi:predicted site-specific integrase-resolvase